MTPKEALAIFVDSGTPPGWKIRFPPEGTVYTPQILSSDGGILAEMTCYGAMNRDARKIALAVNLSPLQTNLWEVVAAFERRQKPCKHGDVYYCGWCETRKALAALAAWEEPK